MSQPVDHPHPVSDQVCPVGGQQAQVADQVTLVADNWQVAPDPCGLGDHKGVLGICLALSGIGAAHGRDQPPGCITRVLAGLAEHGQQQGRWRPDDVNGPGDLCGKPGHRADHSRDPGLVIGDPGRQQLPAVPVNHADPVMPLADVNPCPGLVRCSWHAHAPFLRSGVDEPVEHPADTSVTSDRAQISISSQGAPGRAGRTFPVSDRTARRPQPHPALPGYAQSYGR